jgi:phage-related protein
MICVKRSISWLKGALREFEAFPADVQIEMFRALTVAAEGGKSDNAKPFKGVGSGVFEIAMRHRGDAFRAIYAVQIGVDLWVFMHFRRNRRPESRLRKPTSTLSRNGSND